MAVGALVLLDTAPVVPVLRSRSDVRDTIQTASRELSSASTRLLETLSASGGTLPATINATYRTIEDLGVVVNPENRNPEKFPDDVFSYVDLSSVSFNVFEGVQTLKGSEAPSRARRVIRERDVLLATVRPYLTDMEWFRKR